MPPRRCLGGNRRARAANDNPGVVQEHIQAPEPGDGLLDCSFAVFRAGHIGGDEESLALLSLYLPHRLLSSSRIVVGNRDRRALLGEEKCSGLPDAGSSTGDERPPSLENPHRFLTRLKTGPFCAA